MTREIAGLPQTKDVPLRTGLPTREELLVYYPARFTWNQLKTFINSGDLGLLKRDIKLQQRYNEWAVDIVDKYGSVVNYLLHYRLQWGKPDTLSLLTSALDAEPRADKSIEPHNEAVTTKELPPLPSNAPAYFTVDTPAEYISIIQNDWPYSVPAEVEHTLIWTRIPIFHPSLISPLVKARIDQDGLWGFTGSTSPPPSPSSLPSCLPALSDWNITLEKMVISPKASEEEEILIKTAGEHVHEFVKRRWHENGWETTWFVNPPRLQSVLGLAHIHVFAKQKRPLIAN